MAGGGGGGGGGGDDLLGGTPGVWLGRAAVGLRDVDLPPNISSKFCWPPMFCMTFRHIEAKSVNKKCFVYYVKQNGIIYFGTVFIPINMLY